MLYLALWGCAGQWCKSVQGGDLSQAFPKGAAAFILLPTTPVPWNRAGTAPPPPALQASLEEGMMLRGFFTPNLLACGSCPKTCSCSI